MIVLLRGLPGSGKSTLAQSLAPRIQAVILNKDLVRAALFPGETTEYTTAQDDFVIGLMLHAAQYHLERKRRRDPGWAHARPAGTGGPGARFCRKHRRKVPRRGMPLPPGNGIAPH